MGFIGTPSLSGNFSIMEETGLSTGMGRLFDQLVQTSQARLPGMDRQAPRRLWRRARIIAFQFTSQRTRMLTLALAARFYEHRGEPEAGHRLLALI
jgi:hypothetical protein